MTTQCYGCGGKVERLAKPRSTHLPGKGKVPLPADFELPTCVDCGAEWVRHDDLVNIGAAAKASYLQLSRAQAFEIYCAYLKVLAERTSPEVIPALENVYLALAPVMASTGSCARCRSVVVRNISMCYALNGPPYENTDGIWSLAFMYVWLWTWERERQT